MECAQYPMWCEGMPALLFGYVRYLQVPEKENRAGLDENEFMKRGKRNCLNRRFGWSIGLGES